MTTFLIAKQFARHERLLVRFCQVEVTIRRRPRSGVGVPVPILSNKKIGLEDMLGQTDYAQEGVVPRQYATAFIPYAVLAGTVILPERDELVELSTGDVWRVENPQDITHQSTHLEIKLYRVMTPTG